MHLLNTMILLQRFFVMYVPRRSAVLMLSRMLQSGSRLFASRQSFAPWSISFDHRLQGSLEPLLEIRNLRRDLLPSSF
jgi:hypothetical protein